MKAFEFLTHPTADGSIQLPLDVSRQVDASQEIKVIVMLPDDEDQAWNRFGMEQFFKGYAPSDNIYDDLRAG
ncbi:MAG TPA: hypothetical protein VFV87_06885 [Pirellulaceae bacterium]|nr:hypothetical protein [Pirellulaceae bacterium]